MIGLRERERTVSDCSFKERGLGFLDTHLNFDTLSSGF